VSNGGLAAAFIAWKHPDLFGNALSQSGAFWQGSTSSAFTVPEETEFEWLTKQYAASTKLPLRIYLEAGMFENAGVNQGPSLLTANRHLRDILEIKGYTFRYNELSGCNHIPLCWRGSLGDALIFLGGKDPSAREVPRQ
jgi:enterochelin esterase-like enzyme